MAPEIHSPKPAPFSNHFPRAKDYQSPAPQRHTTVQETSVAFGHLQPGFNERHLQAIWYDPTLRPGVLKTIEGEDVRIIDPGIWNLEAGPDFLGAVIEIGPQSRRLAGDAEVHIHPRGWNEHGHGDNPNFNHVRIHISWFNLHGPAPDLPAGCEQIALKDQIEINPHFSFDIIELSSYPFGTRAATPPCFRVLKTWDADRKCALLTAAGEERLRRKAEKFAWRFKNSDEPRQVFYEEWMTAMGYKKNKTPFRQLAENLPLFQLKERSGEDADHAFAVLAGLSGLLPDRLNDKWDHPTRRYTRKCWDIWWKHRAQLDARRLTKAHWNLHSIRPPNQPLRRLAATAAFFTQNDPVELCSLESWLEKLSQPSVGYWSNRYTLGGAILNHQPLWLGSARAAALHLNLILPWLAARTNTPSWDSEQLDQLPQESPNQIMRQTAHYLFGPDHPPSLYKSALQRQGLIQIFHDYCLNDRSRCNTCAFPQLLRNREHSKTKDQP